MSISGSGASARENIPTSLYLYYDQFDVLLYVGITSRGIKRNLEHNADKEWWQYVSRQEVRHLPDRPAALRAERDLIIQLNPPFNKVHNPDHESLAAAYRRFISQPMPAEVVVDEQEGIPLRREDWSDGGLIHLELGEREGKFLRCWSRADDVVLATLVDLKATRFDSFKAKDGSIGRLMSLTRELYGFEMVLKGSWLSVITGVAVLIERLDSGYVIQSLQLKYGHLSQVVQSMGLTDSHKGNFGKFSNGAQWRPKTQAAPLMRGEAR
jgi:hypothetical protein